MSTQKTRSLGQVLENFCIRSQGHILLFNTHEIWSESLLWWFLGQVWKSVILNQKLGQQVKSYKKPCRRHRGYIFCPLLFKDCRNMCLHDISDELIMGHVRRKTRSQGPKNLMYASEATFSVQHSWKLVTVFVMIIFPMSFGNGLCRVKN